MSELMREYEQMKNKLVIAVSGLHNIKDAAPKGSDSKMIAIDTLKCIQDDKQEEWICERCGGSGGIEDCPCPDCGGTGENKPDEPDEPREGDLVWVTSHGSVHRWEERNRHVPFDRLVDFSEIEGWQPIVDALKEIKGILWPQAQRKDCYAGPAYAVAERVLDNIPSRVRITQKPVTREA